jgi:hypothetical protein
MAWLKIAFSGKKAINIYGHPQIYIKEISRSEL